MLDSMLEVFGQFERSLIRMRIKAALDVKRQQFPSNSLTFGID
jgi:DNA invertase Pin-like site-specific DNA recombinase